VVALQFADELGAAGPQAGGDRVDVLDGEGGKWADTGGFAGACR
jgi:hypothetical protein